MQGELRLQPFDDAENIGLAVGTFLVELFRDALVGVRLEVTERPVFHFPFDLPHAKPVRQWRKQLARLLAECRARSLVLCGRTPQRMGTLGQFHQHHTDVFDHRQHHLAQGFELRMRVDAPIGGTRRQRLDAGHCRHTARQPCRQAESRPELGGIVQAALQQRRRHGIGSHTQLRDDERSTERMAESGCTAHTFIGPGQRLPGQIVLCHGQGARQCLARRLVVGHFGTTGSDSVIHG